MKKVSKERRLAVLARLGPPFNEPVKDVAEAEGLSLTTVYNWLNAAKAEEKRLIAAREEPPPKEEPLPVQGEASKRWTARDKFAAVVEAEAMNETERSAYCRRRGLYPEDLALWRKACEKAPDWANELSRQRVDANKAAQRRIRNLERELARKEQALAEAAALLILRKKAAAIWGDEDA